MPAKSASQRRFFGMVDAYKKGKLKNASSEVKKAADGMSMKQVRDFAKTKEDGLPEKVEENSIRLKESDLHRIVKESVRKVLKENNNAIGNEFKAVLDSLFGAISKVRTNELANAQYMCKENIEMYGGFSQRLKKISLLLMDAARLAKA